MVKFFVEIEWQIAGLHYNRRFEDDYFCEILEILSSKCVIKDFSYHIEFVAFDLVLSASNDEEAKDKAIKFTKDSFISVLNGSNMILVSTITKELIS